MLATMEAAPVLRQTIANLLVVVAQHTGSGAGGGTAAGAHTTPRRDTGFGGGAAVKPGAEAEVKAVVEAAAARGQHQSGGNPRQRPVQRHPPLGAQNYLAASLAAAIIGVTCRTSAARTNLKHALWLHCNRCPR